VVNMCDDAKIPDVLHFLVSFFSCEAKIVFFGAKI
jgi:hypothetical protein